MTHKHCDKCFLINCLDSSSCPLISCPNGCFARMHECKRQDHEYICSNSFIPCLNVNYGCPLTIQRSQLTQHLRVCPASVVVCSFIYNHEYQFDRFDNSATENLVQTIAVRDNIWDEHRIESERKHDEMFQKLRPNRMNKIEKPKVIRSIKYPYITMPECMLDRGSGAICSTCRKHLRNLEEEEDQRISEMNEEEQQQMLEFIDNYDETSNLNTGPSLLRMSSTLLNSSDVPVNNPSPLHSTTELFADEPLPIISDTEMPSSQIYRLKYFSSNSYSNNLTSFNKLNRFHCNALCRRDEIAQHWLVHFHVDCILNTALIQQCPKAQYGCTFQYERLEPCQTDGQSIKICFDKTNDAIAFNWYPIITKGPNQTANLLDFPTELLEKILMHLDSLSLRNVSCVCRRLRTFCEQLLPSRGIVIAAYQRHPLSHGDITWTERKKHWFFTNTTSTVPKWQLKEPNKLTSLSQHMITCPYGETKDLENEPPFELVGWTNRKVPQDADES